MLSYRSFLMCFVGLHLVFVPMGLADHTAQPGEGGMPERTSILPPRWPLPIDTIYQCVPTILLYDTGFSVKIQTGGNPLRTQAIVEKFLLGKKSTHRYEVEQDFEAGAQSIIFNGSGASQDMFHLAMDKTKQDTERGGVIGSVTYTYDQMRWQYVWDPQLRHYSKVQIKTPVKKTEKIRCTEMFKDKPVLRKASLKSLDRHTGLITYPMPIELQVNQMNAGKYGMFTLLEDSGIRFNRPARERFAVPDPLINRQFKTKEVTSQRNGVVIYKAEEIITPREIRQGRKPRVIELIDRTRQMQIQPNHRRASQPAWEVTVIDGNKRTRFAGKIEF